MNKQNTYFQCFNDYFWNMEYDTEIQDYLYCHVRGNTIIRRSVLLSYLDSLKETGFPAFGALLLVISASNYNAQEDLEKVKFNTARFQDKLSRFYNEHLNLESSFSFLKTISQLPAYIKEEKNMNVLLSVLFEKSHRPISPSKSKRLAQYQLEDEFSEVFNILQPHHYYHDFKTLELLSRQFPDVETIVEAFNGFSEIEEELIDEELVKTKNKEGDYIEELIDDPETFHIGSLVKQIWSGLRMFQQKHLPSGKPSGGVYDINNKGDFNQLLISELANDQDIFLSRLVNNEALYIEKEIPPQSEKLTRIFLIDTSVKNWGTPKIISHAISIAISKHPKNDMPSKFFLVNNGYEEVDLMDLTAIIESSKNLSVNLEPTIGLNSFFRDFKEEGNAEIYFLSTEEIFNEAKMQLYLQGNANQIDFVFTSNLDGEVSFYSLQNGGRKYINSFDLPLDSLWRKKAEIKKTIIKDYKKGSAFEIPLLFPIQKTYRSIFKLGEYFYFVKNRMLFQFLDLDTFSKGHRLISENVYDYNQQSFIGKYNEKDELILISFDKINQSVLLQNLHTNQSKSGQNDHIDTHKSKSSFFIFNKEVYLFIDNELSWYKLDEISLKLTLLDIRSAEFLAQAEKYVVERNDFIKDYAKNRRNCLMKGALRGVDIENFIIFINGEKCVKYGFEIEYDSHRLTQLEFNHSAVNLVDLYFKKAGDSGSNLFDLMREKLAIDEAEVRSMIESDNETCLLEEVTWERGNYLKNDIEATGAVSFIKERYFQFNDGSKVSKFQNVLIFESSNDKIPKFYITHIADQLPAFATAYEFAGNEYYFDDRKSQTVISTEDFFTKYINVFLQTIMDYES